MDDKQLLGPMMRNTSSTVSYEFPCLTARRAVRMNARVCKKRQGSPSCESRHQLSTSSPLQISPSFVALATHWTMCDESRQKALQLRSEYTSPNCWCTMSLPNPSSCYDSIASLQPTRRNSYSKLISTMTIKALSPMAFTWKLPLGLSFSKSVCRD